MLIDYVTAIRPPLVKKDERPPLLILLHGYGSNEQDLMGLAPMLDPNLLIVALRGPVELDFGGYAWFGIEWTEQGTVYDTQRALQSRDELIDWVIKAPCVFESDPKRTYIGGFSQGAMMSAGVVFARPELLSGAILLSGALVKEFEPPETLDSLPVYIQHGNRDETLPLDKGRALRKMFYNLDALVEYREYAMGHEVSMESLSDLKSWMSRCLPLAGTTVDAIPGR